MRRPWTFGSVVAGAALLGYAAIAFALDLGGPEVAEALGGTALILGAFLLAEGLLAIRRVRRLEALDPRGRSPK